MNTLIVLVYSICQTLTEQTRSMNDRGKSQWTTKYKIYL